MKQPDIRFRKYYKTGKYKGFYKLSERHHKLTHSTKLVFTDGQKKVVGSGTFKEQALINIFDQIDKFSLKQLNKAETKGSSSALIF